MTSGCFSLSKLSPDVHEVEVSESYIVLYADGTYELIIPQVDNMVLDKCPFYALECPFYAMCIIFWYVFSEILLSTRKGGNEKATEVLHNMIDMEI